jgi:PAS domain S-box-containing protein
LRRDQGKRHHDNSGHNGLDHDRLVKIIEESTGEIFIFRLNDFRFVFVNRGAQENLGYSAAELLMMSPLDIKPRFTKETFRALVDPVVSGAVGHIDFETLHQRKDGTTYGCAIRLQLIPGDEQLFYASVLDISDRMVAENELRETSQRLNAILENTTMAVFLMDERQQCVFMNRAAEQLTGYTLAETVGRPLHDVVHHTHPDGRPFPIEDCAIDRALPERMQMQGREVFVHKDGHFYDVSFTASPILNASGHPVGTVIEARDIADELRAEARAKAFNEELAEQVRLAVAEREALTRQLIQAQKMEAIGNLTGGIAHDFNNLLQVVSGNLDLLARIVRADERALARVEAARAGVLRGGRLASQLLSFARRQPLRPLVLNAGRLIRDMNEMLRSTLGEAVELECVIAGGLWTTSIDATQLESALLNLTINARDAMEGQGKLTIEAGNALLDDAYCREHLDVLPGQYVVIAVSDTGPGMTAEV